MTIRPRGVDAGRSLSLRKKSTIRRPGDPRAGRATKMRRLKKRTIRRPRVV
jgi:hypothetical protein